MTRGLTPSGRANPCPICGRDKDGDCRIGEEMVHCRYGSTFSPPSVAIGDVITGEGDGNRWALTGDSSCGTWAVFVPHDGRGRPGGGGPAGPRPPRRPGVGERQAFAWLEAAGQLEEGEVFLPLSGRPKTAKRDGKPTFVPYSERWLAWSSSADPDDVAAAISTAEVIEEAIAAEERPWEEQVVEELKEEAKSKKRPTKPAEKLTALQDFAASLLKNPFSQRMPLLRDYAQSLEITLRDQELQGMIWRARREAAGTIEPLRPGDRIDFTPDPWLWQGFIMAKALNLLVALPKIGKTSLMLAMIGAWRVSAGQFLGADLIGACPPVLIIGTDQPVSDWGRMMQQVALLNGESLAHPVVGLFHRGAPLHLDAEGIERVAGFAAEHPGLLILLDSVAACTGPLGLDENSSEIVEPINDLMEAVTPHGATVVAIHHASKGRAGQGATLASRGSTALPAAASQVLALDRVQTNPGAAPDRRLVFRTEGRGGLPQQILIERTDDGWICHGSAEDVQVAQHLAALEEKLTDRQAEALEAVRERWSAHQLRTDAKGLAAALGGTGGDDRQARRTLDQLARKGILRSITEATLQGRAKWFWPVGAGDRTPSRGGVSDVPYVSHVSDPPSRVDPGLSKEVSHTKGSDTKHTKDTSDTPPREGVLTVSDPLPAGSEVSVYGEPGWRLAQSITSDNPRGEVLVTSPAGKTVPAPITSIAGMGKQ